MASANEKYPFNTVRESIINKDWAAGSAKQAECDEIVLAPTSAAIEKITLPAALLKIIDEPIVNCIDQVIINCKSDHPVTKIEISLSKDGLISIMNNGLGIDVVYHDIASKELKQEIYVPTLIFGVPFQGSNKVKKLDSITGGTNGLGAKISNCYSTEFTLETVDAARGKHFVQHWRDRMNIAEPPIIKDSKAKPYTKLSFRPDYENIFKYKKFNSALYIELNKIVHTRVIWAAAYAHWGIKGAPPKARKLTITYNDEPINVASIANIASSSFAPCKYFATELKPNMAVAKNANFTHNMELVVILNDKFKFAGGNVNGIVVRSESTHIKYIKELLITGITEYVMKQMKNKDIKIPKSLISNDLNILINTKVPCPDWEGQRKDIMKTDIRSFYHYDIDKKIITEIAKELENKIMVELLGTKSKKEKNNKIKIKDHSKFIDAHEAGSKNSHLCHLIAVEGDSAKSQAEEGVTMTVGMGYKRYGIISLGGVILSVRRQSEVMDIDGKYLVKQSKTMEKNILINAMKEYVGLNINYKYDPSSVSYKREMSELRYGTIDVFVDQDLDGKGNILGLFISNFEHLWPNLLRDGFVRWLSTPIIRAFPRAGGQVQEFYETHNFDSWTRTVNIDKYKVKYYKGIGTNNNTEIINIFKNYNNRVRKFIYNESMHEIFEIYFGDDPDKRKVELAKPTIYPSITILEEQERTKSINCDDLIKFENNLYQKDNLDRKLDSVIDGFNQASRKIFNGSRKALPSISKELKIPDLAGQITSSEHYHHGEAVLYKSITMRGFIAVGGRQLPLFIPVGNFGTRKMGGKDAAQARYLYTRLNRRLTDLLYPDDDYYLLDFNTEEGEIVEPKYFVPIIPTVICESIEIPAHGWKLKLWARDVTQVISNVTHMINSDGNKNMIKPLLADTTGWHGRIENYNGSPYSCGTYKLDGVKVIITELPLRVWTNKYLATLRDKAEKYEDVIKDIFDESNSAAIKIIVVLKKGGKEYIEAHFGTAFRDPFEHFFALKEVMDSNINLFGPNREVLSFNHYEDVLVYWYKYRRDLYIARVERKIILYKIWIEQYYPNVIRFAQESKKETLANRREEDMIALLAERKFTRINRAMLNEPKYIKNEQLEDEILRGDKATYDYLLDMTDRKKSLQAIEKYHDELRDIIKEYNDFDTIISIGPFKGAMIWINELCALQKVIADGKKTEWKFEEKNKYKF